MNQEQTIALWQRCEDARAAALAQGRDEDEAHEAATAIWNGWASDLLARKAGMEKSGTWAAERNRRGDLEAKNEDTLRWMDAAKADFSGLGFLTRARADVEETQAGKEAQKEPGSPSGAVRSLLLETKVARFDGWIFPGHAQFGGAQFSGPAGFGEVQFSGPAQFGKAQFSGPAGFGKAQFSGDAGFGEAQFSGAAVFEEAQFTGAAWFGEAQFTGDARFWEAQFTGDAWFEKAQFTGDARFWEAQFTGPAVFEKAQFTGDARFGEAQFTGAAVFEKAQFTGPAVFEKAQFTGPALFEEAQFSGDARFEEAQFLSSEHEADFSQAHFERYTTFKDTLFRAGAKFDAIRSESTFDLAGASFEALPGFIQANFKEPPRFDHLTLKTPLARSEPKETLADAWWICARQLRERRADLSMDAKAEAREETSKFRALKALAIKAHDGEREHLFHKGELRGRRLSDNEGWAVFIGNIAYDLLSDFGRSFLRPLAVWAGLALGVAVIYWVSFLLTPARDGCGWLSAFGHSLYLATRSGLVLLGRARDQRLTDAYLCLFGPRTVSAGVPPDPPHPPADPIPIAIPDIPGWVTFAEMAHTLISVILIFLIALALRNQFKIK